ncbi:MAG TPA: hypothetical protein VK395_19410 [Gemmataceae bacterium]|nr:hypothetical protein [Gemmataceae bacterium]
MADMPAGYTFGAQAIRSLQETARQTKRAALNRPHDQYAAPPDVSSPEIHAVLISSALPNAAGYYTGNVLQIATPALPWTVTNLGSCLALGLNNEALAPRRYMCRLHGPDASSGSPVFIPTHYYEPWALVNSSTPVGSSLYNATIAWPTLNSPGFTAGPSCWLYAPMGLPLTGGDYYEARFAGVESVSGQQRILVFAAGGWVSGNGVCSGNNVVMPTY